MDTLPNCLPNEQMRTTPYANLAETLLSILPGYVSSIARTLPMELLPEKPNAIAYLRYRTHTPIATFTDRHSPRQHVQFVDDL